MTSETLMQNIDIQKDKFFFFDSKRDNYILIKQPHQEGGAERKIKCNGSLKKENTKVKRDLIS